MTPEDILPSTKHDVYPFIDPRESLKDCAKGKTVLVTGAGQGIGKIIAEYYALAGAAKVVLTGRRGPLLEEAKASIQKVAPDCNIFTAILDILERDSVERLFSELQGEHGAGVPDVLVNNAGTCLSQKPLVDSDPDMWWKDCECNIRGTYLCCRSYLIALNGKPGTIINITSIGSTGAPRLLSAYSAGKIAMNRLTEYIDQEHSQQGVRSFSLHPGAIGTSEMGQMAPDWLKPLLTDKDDIAAGSCLYLSTPKADFLKGRYINANWDMEELEKMKDVIMSKDILKTRVTMY